MSWRTVANAVCKAHSWDESKRSLKQDWLPAFKDPAPDGSHANPTGRWGRKAANAHTMYFECRAHEKCERELRVRQAEGGGCSVTARGAHNHTQARLCLYTSISV